MSVKRYLTLVAKMENDKKDVGFLEDALMILQNQTAVEHHAEMSWLATHDDFFLDLKDMVRKHRSTLLYSLITKAKGQSYCIVKHSSTIAQGYKELAARKMEVGNKKEAKELLETSERYELLMRELIKQSQPVSLVADIVKSFSFPFKKKEVK